MDFYAKNEAACKQLHDEIVKDIRTVLSQKGYEVGSSINRGEFEILGDRLIIDGRHTDHLSIDEVLRYLRKAYHVLPRMSY